MKLKNYFFMALGMLLSVPAFSAVSIREAEGWLESGYVTFDLVDGASTYAVYYKVSGGEYLKLDSELVRNYGDYGRADALGLTAGNYQFKVVPVDAEGVEMADQAAESDIVEVRAHDRAGFAHLDYSGVGAYQDNGQLKSGAKVLYVTKDNCNTVQMDVEGASENPCIGIGTILKAYEKGKVTTPLAIRIIGDITKEKADTLREADAIFREEVAAAGEDKLLSQYFAALTNMRSVGVMGDGRTYDYALALRAVVTDDFMTAEWARIPYEILDRISVRVVNQVPGINRVLYDITSKPPATVEFE